MNQPVYTFVYVQVKDHDDYMDRYGRHLGPIIEKFGGRFLAATKTAGVVEGEQPGNWAVLAEFPSMEAAQGFYGSDEYAPYLKLRREELSDGSLMISFAKELPRGIEGS
ncbi:DUF1330 domain-containing protein [Parvularcula lutaonensis]|uniref:DUF1330 domain-containing protein n=1 Tax=Parvularcula lutaonensis TaxID=491923 RepID=A0ABV7MBB5_9PROT|nr:DUF1330 domain-containing protein [Parvularcula lutaonensis]GGY39821.1 hypothetical protein GCM10007148_05330 [Parvularcula lutaonensis]